MLFASILCLIDRRRLHLVYVYTRSHSPHAMCSSSSRPGSRPGHGAPHLLAVCTNFSR
nr:MAG TPA: hypothetical protein [Caudoviricetes sp.]